MSQIVIGDISPYTQATAILNQVVFGTNWTANYASDVVVYVTPFGDAADDALQILSYPSEYSVSFVGAQQQVQVTLVTPSAAGNIVTITRQTPADRTNLYTNTNFTPSMLNNDFGILTLVDQQAQLVDQKIGPRYNYSSIIRDVIDTILPILGPDEIWAKNSADDAIIAVSLSNIVSDGTVTQINTGLGLTGGPITVTGTVAMLPTLPDSIQLNITKLGAMSQALNMNTHLINNVTDPVSAQDAVTKNYVDTIIFNEFLPLTGGTMSGIINMGNNKITNLTDPTAPQDAVTLASLNSALGSYLPLSGGVMAGLINMNSNKITNLPEPLNPQDAATKNYVDTVATGFTVQPACYAATTTALTATYANGASGIGATLTNSGALAQFTTDGVSPPTNARILFWNQTDPIENGIYTLTNQGSGAVAWIATRATDYDQPTEIEPGDLVIINNGALYEGTSFIQTDSVAAVGTDPIQFSQFTFSASAVLLKANNLSDVANTVTAFNNISPLTTKGDLIAYNSGNVRLPVGATDGQIFQVSSGAATGLAWSTATYPSTTTANQILYSSSTNVVVGLATLAGGVLVTDAAGVPSMLTNPAALGRILMSANAAIPLWSTATYPAISGAVDNVLTSDGTNWISSAPTPATTTAITDDTTTNATMYPTWVTANTGNLPLKVTSTKLFYNPSTGLLTNVGALGAITGIQSSAGANLLTFTYTGSAVNYLQITNNTTGNSPQIASVGSDPAIPFSLLTKNSYVGLIDYTGTIAPPLRFYNAAGNQYTSLAAANAQASTAALILPAAVPAVNNAIMVGSTGGVLSFSSVPYPVATGWTTFTPTVTLVGGAGNTVPTYSTNVGRYTQIGNTVFVSILLDNAAGGTAGAGTGVINIALPVPISGSITTGQLAGGQGTLTNSAAFVFLTTTNLVASGTTVTINLQTAISTVAAAVGGNQSDAVRRIALSFFYEI